METILLNKACKYHKCVFGTEFISAIIQNPMEKSHWLLLRGNQGDANFLVGLQKYVITAPLYLDSSSGHHEYLYQFHGNASNGCQDISPTAKNVNPLVASEEKSGDDQNQ